MHSILVLMILILSILGYGLLGLRMIGCTNAQSWGEDYGRAFALGMGTLGWLVFWFGISGFLQTWILWVILTPGVLSLLFLHKNLKSFSFKEIGNISWMLLMLLMISVSMDLLEALAPPADADTLAYHFAIPKQFLKNGVIEFLPVAVDGAIPLLSHMIYLLALGLGGEPSLTLWSFTTQIFLALALYGVGRRWLSREWSLALVLVFETTPAVIYGGGSGHMEVRTAIFMLIGAMAVAEGVKHSSLSLVILAGLMAGFFMGSKYFGLFAVTGIGTVILLQKNCWRTVMIFSVTVLISGTQWYGWNWYHSGMPVFPTMYHFMGSPESPFWNEAIHQEFQKNYSNFVCVPANTLWLVLYPFATTFNPESCFDSGRVGLGPFLWLLLPGVLYSVWHYRLRFRHSLLFKLSIPAMVYYVLWFLIPSNQMSRHLLPVFPIALLGATIVIHHLTLDGHQAWGHLLWKMSATTCILIGFVIQSIFSLNYMKYHFLNETRDTFYSRNVGSYNVVQWINKNLTSSDRIVNPIRYLNYLIEVPYFYLKSYSQIQIETHSLANTERIIGQLNTENISHTINWTPMADTLVHKDIFNILISFDTEDYLSRTLGISVKSKSRIFSINNEIK